LPPAEVRVSVASFLVRERYVTRAKTITRKTGVGDGRAQAQAAVVGRWGEEVTKGRAKRPGEDVGRPRTRPPSGRRSGAGTDRDHDGEQHRRGQ
jgi:hypothetical protein